MWDMCHRIFLGSFVLIWIAGGPTHASSQLEFNPPSVVVKYGDPVSVLCSTSHPKPNGMGWEATIGGVSFQPDVSSVTWTVDKLEDWTIEPMCYISTVDGQSSKTLSVILYKTPDSVSISPLNHSGPMVEGTEYHLLCDIKNVAPLQNLVVKWYKGNESILNVTYSDLSIKSPGDVFPNLTITPSRDDDGAQYRCEAELDLGPEGPQPPPTVTSEPLNITVHSMPSNIQELEDTVIDVGSSTRLKCSSNGNPPPEFSWVFFRSPNVRVENKDAVIIENATGANIGNYTCVVKNYIGNVSKTARISVRGADPVCPIKLSTDSVVIKYGDEVSVSCINTASVEDMYWIIDSQHVNNTTWSVKSRLNWDTTARCTGIFLGIGNCHKPLNITVYKAPDSVSIFPLNHSGPMVERKEYHLLCDIKNVAPLQNLVVKWYKGDESILNVTYSDLSIKTPGDVFPNLTITPSRDDDGAHYRCEAELDLGPEGPQPPPTMTSEPLNITVHYKPHITSQLPERIPVFRGYPVELSCVAHGNPQPRIEWRYDTANHVTHAGGNLTVYEAGLYNCTATNAVETVFVVVVVILKEDYLPLIAGFVAVMVVVISVIFVFIYSIYYKNTKMGRYSLKDAKLASTPNGNVAQNGCRDIPLPMTKLSQPNINF
ncbi:hypothetical protein DPEC_G00279530 [Dallia pectoralis]|uniref:Uncharacterized protein n=1 Tax=Dallia pectoralis TaxID=75939 RepID=A0ACC2FMQ1_DALPE|nr:hypothetical protein DPEC_G00279530 [Dallia pectoralis]